MICAPWLVRAAKTCSGLQRLFDTAVPTSGARHAALNRLPLVVVRKRPTLTSFHPTPPGSPSLLQVSINSEEVQGVTASTQLIPLYRPRAAEGVRPKRRRKQLTAVIKGLI